jgi:Polyketide cyclase / dehydrase and lipid transport
MPQFHMAADVFIDRPIGEVRAFLAEPDSIVRWDRSVSKMVSDSFAPLKVGARFATIGPFRGGREGKRSEYRVLAIDGDESKAELTNSQLFKSAVWTMRLAAKGDGTTVECEMDMATDLLRAPVGLLLKLNKKAIATDLQFLKRAIENGEVAKR